MKNLSKKKKLKSVLIIGSGGREHALTWKVSQSSFVSQVFCCPGNAGTSLLAKNILTEVKISQHVEPTDVYNLLTFAKNNKIDLTIVGPEAPLEAGIVDLFLQSGMKIFGPTKRAAKIESSKVWAVKFMERHKIPHPKSKIFSNPDKAKNYIRSFSRQKIVVKADGLCLGKGVIVPNTIHEAINAVDRIMIHREFGKAGKKIVIQEKLTGQEVSLLVLTDGKTIIPLPPVCDHKPIFDGDKGPNTGGIGAYSPVPFVTEELLNDIFIRIVEPAINGMREEGRPYRGVLYIGLMITKVGPQVLEFNARFGDPETQVQMMLLNGNLFEIMLACAEGNLNKKLVSVKKGASCCVVLTSKGYPGHYEKGEIIHGLSKIKDPHIQIFHAGTTIRDGKIVTNGGRVLGVTAYGKTLEEAIKKSYSTIGKHGVYFNNMYYRKDIGRRNY